MKSNRHGQQRSQAQNEVLRAFRNPAVCWTTEEMARGNFPACVNLRRREANNLGSVQKTVTPYGSTVTCSPYAL
jgi:hypothetical protein